MNDKSVILHEFLLLFLNLAQIKQKELAVDLFQQAWNHYDLGIQLVYSDETVEGEACEPIATNKNAFGFFILRQKPDRAMADILPLARNQIKLLAVILENLQRENLLENERQNLERTVEERVAEIKESELALKQSEEKFRALYENAPLPYQSLDNEGCFIDVNPAWLRTLGYDREEVIGQCYADFLHPDWKPHFEKNFSAFKKRGYVNDVQFKIRHKNGDYRDISFEGCIGYNPDGSFRQTYCVFQDITERKRAEQELATYRVTLEQRVAERTAELQKRKEEAETLTRGMTNLLQDLQTTNRDLLQAEQTLRESNRELESFSYSVSHDLRAPLRHIDGFVQMLLKRESGNLDSTSVRYLETISQSSKRMSRLIDDLLALSRTGRADMTFQPTDSNRLVHSVIEELSPLTKDRRIVWDIADLPPAVADRSLLRQVWSNLIGNAIKYTANRSEARIEIGATHEKEDEESVFYICDNGAGFDSQYAYKLFGVFQRLHRDDEFEGTGIGLATVKRIILRHGGRVWAEGKLDEGATFYFTLKNTATTKT